ncbi:MAG: DNA-binding protein [Gemmatimonadetes bacterium]|nr:DNA-binding protein [Gemmatimonadota bacterium]
MNRQELQNISRARRREGAALLKAGHHAGAYYLVGYAVECALKACIAKQTRRHDFPDKHLANKVYTHNLEQLVRVAGLEQDLKNEMVSNPTFALNWTIVKDWTVDSRYVLSASKSVARDLYSACTSRKYGVLAWIRNRW